MAAKMAPAMKVMGGNTAVPLPEVSVIIPVWNRRDDLRRCLVSTRGQKGAATEIIVVDDGSDDGGPDMLRQDFPDVLSLSTGGRCGPSLARNVGIQAARGEFLLFLDSDTTWPAPDAVAQLAAFLRLHDAAGCVGGELAGDGRVCGRRLCFDGDSRALFLEALPGAFRECDFLATCCCMLRRELACLVGGFDPAFVFGGEDKDFGFRVRRAGRHNYIVAAGAVAHHHSPAGRLEDETFRYHATRLRFALKNFTLLQALACMLLALAQVFWFHAALVPKLIVQACLQKKMRRENLAGGLLLARALAGTLNRWRGIRAARRATFLSCRFGATPGKQEQEGEEKKR